jgi:FixJ family two-component response regulator
MRVPDCRGLRSRFALRSLHDRYASLSHREREVMARVETALLKQVGGELDISEITVKAHRGKAMRKMKADWFADLVTMAAALGIGKRETAER